MNKLIQNKYMQNKYIWIGWIAVRSNLAYLADVVSRFIFLGVILYIFLRLWQITYAETGVERLGGLTLAQMLWYLVATESIAMSAPRVAHAVDEDVRTGALAVQLLRPVSYPLYRLAACLGERIVRFLMNLSVGSVIALFLVGPIDFDAVGLIVFALALPLAFILDFLGTFLIGLGAFWLEDTSGLNLLYSRMSLIVGGGLLPLELFPDFLRPVVQVLPFASMSYGPARMLVRPDWLHLAQLIVQQIFWIAVLGTAVMLVYRTALKRVFANGG